MRLTLTDDEGVVLDTWRLVNGQPTDEPTDDDLDISKPLAWAWLKDELIDAAKRG